MAPFSKQNISDDELLREWIIYDPGTGILRWRKRYGKRGPGVIVGHNHSKGYLMFRLRGRSYYNHRAAWFLHTGSWPKDQIDHINGKKKDNRIENLREATNQQNHLAYKPVWGSSGYRGVSYDKHPNRGRKRWLARIKADGKTRNLGYYLTPEEARDAYNAASELLLRSRHSRH